MIGFELEDVSAAELVRFVRTLGQHRYCEGRLHLVHAFAIDAAGERPELADAREWAKRALGGVVDIASKDERLYRRATDAELVAVLEAFWTGDAASRLAEHLARIDAMPDASALPFDESAEDETFPLLVDAGWQLIPVEKLDPERHRGAIAAFDDYEVAKFEEENHVPPRTTLHELPALGGVELMHAFENDRVRAPFVLWQQGREEYLDYVLRGVLRAAKLGSLA
jgi:hypothetical protein